MDRSTPPMAALQGKLLTEMYKPGHSLRNKRIIRKLILVLVLGVILTGAKLAGGIVSHSLSLISNGAHMFADLLGFVIGIYSVWYSGKPANKMHTYGFHRAGIIGAMTSIMILWVLNGFLVYFGIQRIRNLNDYHVEGKIMFIVACIGLVINLVMIQILNDTTFIFRRRPSACKKRRSNEMSPIKFRSDEENTLSNGVAPNEVNGITVEPSGESNYNNYESSQDIVETKVIDRRKSSLNTRDVVSGNVIHQAREADLRASATPSIINKIRENEIDHENINVRATTLHICGDLLQNLGVILVSALIWIFHERVEIADPIATLIFALVIFISSVFVMKDCIAVLMESSPKGFSHANFESELKAITGVVEIHDLHIWSLGVAKNTMSVHILTDGKTGPVLKRVTALTRKYEIYHSTIQVETTRDEKNKDYVNCKHNIH